MLTVWAGLAEFERELIKAQDWRGRGSRGSSDASVMEKGR
jgi:hypothetical protein